MEIYNSKLWIEDIDAVIESMPWLSELSGKSVMITGAGGLICSSIVDVLIRFNETKSGNIKILAAGRSEKKINERFGEFAGKSYFIFVPYDATKTEICTNEKVDFIIHGASNASPNSIVKEPVETMMCNFTGLLGLLEYGRKQGAKRLLLISSSEVYGKKENNEPYKEEEYGYIDLLNPRSSYSVGKQAAETLCVSYSEEYDLETVIIRPGHIYGPTAAKTDNRVASQWSYAVAGGEDIIMKSDGRQIRSYCYCLDCASAILTAMLNGESRCAYNISNPNSVISIKQMAEILSISAGVKLKIELPTDEERKGFNPMSNSSLDGTRLNDLGWRACFDAETGFSHTVQILKESGRCLNN